MHCRKFLINGSVVGAGFLGAENAIPGLLCAAGTAADSDSNLTLEE
jgi:hypothetical protein